MRVGKLPPGLDEITPIFIFKRMVIEEKRVKEHSTEIFVRNPPYLYYPVSDDSRKCSYLGRVCSRRPGRPRSRSCCVGRPSKSRKIGIREESFQHYIWRLEHRAGFTCPICLEDIEPGDTYYPKRWDALTCRKPSCRKEFYRRKKARVLKVL